MWWQLKLQLVKLWPVAKVKAAQQAMFMHAKWIM
jgi:hypothetical protein